MLINLLKIAGQIARKLGATQVDRKHLLMAAPYGAHFKLGGLADGMLEIYALYAPADEKILLSEEEIREALLTPVAEIPPPTPEATGLLIELQSNSSSASEDEVQEVPAKENIEGISLDAVRHLRQFISERVIGQTRAVEGLCDLLAKATYSRASGPLGCFLFVGPPGVGKTWAAQSLAKGLGGDWVTHTVDMSALIVESQSASLDGNEPSYQGARAGELTSFVRKNPRCVVVLDQCDRANPVILARLTGLLASGFHKDQFGFGSQEDGMVDFRQTIVILTTNAGEAAYDDPGFQKLVSQSPQQAETLMLRELGQLKSSVGKEEQSVFSPAMLSLLGGGRSIFFNHLSFDSLLEIARDALRRELDQFGARFKSTLKLESDSALQALLLGMGAGMNARRVQNDLCGMLLDALTDWMLSSDAALPPLIQIDLSPEARTRLQTEIAPLAGRDLANECFRRNLRLSLSMQFEAMPDAGKLWLYHSGLIQTPFSEDLRGPGAIKVDVPETGFERIAGHLYAKARLKEVAELLGNAIQSPEAARYLPRGILLYGPPGTGKTLLARALANEADLPFVATTGSELLDLSFMRLAFQRARRYAPAILFIDEIDAVGNRASVGISPIINQLLTEIDGFDSSSGAPIFIIAATNLPDAIDPAIIRSGRIDLHIEIPMLDRAAREWFVRRLLELPHADDWDVRRIVDLTSGMNGADLERLERELNLERLRGKPLSWPVLVEHINILKHGVRTSVNLDESARAHTAWHEAGHAIASSTLNPNVRIEQISIAPRQGSLGMVSLSADEESYRRITRKEVMDDLCILLAGRVAQELNFGPDAGDSGASSDIGRATRLAWLAIAKWGLDEEIGLYAAEEGIPADQELITRRVANWLEQAREQTRALLEDSRSKLDALAQRLLEEEIIDGMK